ncbi:NADPH-dependent 2,4-dienoyl-CoA reductase/sulfur reductase-like enzyme [Rhodobium orientis]|uniref:FAD/NAD(P)-binding oxidoreductase n=1 Tax=Rhodobium orientis TaxID=34017 RepID=A0A327JTP9_9HYPH|nr:NAD(P)/FAD-dependent oxidoreductase [Rhodobium orientis]MBB4302806.1 NADPH-dependent 2,4-dienoyl-CoA reductase/sulfur reductase-like enzyme [Rhodobium orientis]MBK5948586.1 hypothetical protein [Rhodobium orientis]RAI29849.1 hypothetical protein CH339_02200 [Rhodobium orientis]
MNRTSCDLAVVGAGPAGMAAASEASALGLRAVVLDEKPGPGGQIYHAITAPRTAARDAVLGPDYLGGLPLVDAFTSSGADYRSGATVWQISEDGVSYAGADGGGDIAASRVLVATGAMERPYPLPGWTLPGVMTAGAAQLLLKGSGLLADDAVFVGTGPLLYLVATQYVNAGARIEAIIDTANPAAKWAALPHLPMALRQSGYIAKGLRMLARIRRSGTKVIHGARDIALEGEDRVAAVTWQQGASGQRQRLACRHVFLHQGVVPNPNMTMAARAAHRWDEAQACWVVDRDTHGRTSLPWLLAAGDGAGIGGAKVAELSGRLAALAAAHDLGRLDAAAFAARSAPLIRRVGAEMAPRPFLDRLYRPADGTLAPQDEATILCRCEEVRRGAVADAVAEGCPGPNQLKSFTRAGMGPCQGRMCGHSIGAVISELSGRSAAEVGYFRLRMPVKPVTLGDIGGMTHAQKEET